MIEQCIYCYRPGKADDMEFIGGGYGHPDCHDQAVEEAQSMTREDWIAEYAALDLYDKDHEEGL